MGTTNSANEYKNNIVEFPFGPGANSPLSEWLFTTTGNKDREKGLPVFNDTFTIPASQQELYANGGLLNWDDAFVCDGSSLFGGDERILSNEYNIAIYGHPDKWVYDYEQSYNNCGVNSCLNILSMAGKKDIVELTSKYQEYLNTGIEKTTRKSVYNSETGEWENQTVTTIVYPKQQPITEDAFLLWAVQNSTNDALWSESTYGEGGFIKNLTDTDKVNYEDFCLHAWNCEDYKTVADLQENPTAVGGTQTFHWANILKANGIEAELPSLTCNVQINATEEIVNPPEAKYEKTLDEQGEVITDTIANFKTEHEDLYSFITSNTTLSGSEIDSAKSITVSTSFNNNYSQKDITVTIVVSSGEGENTTDITYTLNKTEYTKNTEMFAFAEQLHKYIQEGKGVILGGYATEGYKGGNGGGHAITLAGSVVGEVTEGSATFTDGNGTTTEIKGDHSADVIGFYVMDTGGWLGHSESTQFVTVEQLYNFLSYDTYAEYSYSPTSDTPWISGYGFKVQMCVTKENIRDWADELNLVGNKVKNTLSGNDSQNYIYGKGGNDVLFGRGGDDYLYGDQGNDTLHGNEGNDVLTGGAGNDTYVFGGHDGASNDLIITGSGKDVIQFNSFEEDGLCIENLEDMRYYNNKGNLVIEYDIVDNVDNPTKVINTGTVTVKNYFSKNLYSSIKDIQVVNTKRTDIQSAYLMPTDTTENTSLYIDSNEDGEDGERERLDFLTGFIQRGHIDCLVEADKNNTVKGTKYMDSIVAGNRNDSISSGNGNDIINGGASNDTIRGGSGDDVIWGSYGNDKIYGDAGNDRIIYRAVKETDEKGFAGSAYGGHDTIYSGGGEDIIELKDYSSAELKYVKAGNDLVVFYGSDLTTPDGSITIASYFSKKGKTSIKDIILSDKTIDLVGEYNAYTNILEQATSYTGTDGYDKITGNGTLIGGLGRDTLTGGTGNDTLNGGLGSDKLYGKAGDNTYVFDSTALGEDTIYTTGNGKSTLDFTGSGINFDTKGADDAINEYSFTKVKNDLIINYATEEDYSDSDNATIRISSFFTSKNNFEILNADGSTLNLKEQATIYMNGDSEKKNKITGSSYNDLIIGYDFNDTFKGGKGNDTIVGGKGNDNLTGGVGTNEIQYAAGDGMDTITLTKGENLDIKLTGFTVNSEEDAKTQIFDYDIVKNNLVISYIDDEGKKTSILTLKNFGTKDVTGAETNVKLYNDGSEIMDLRNGDYLDTYTAFTKKKYSYNGNWHAEEIDASAINYEPGSGDRGVKVNAKAGDDTIIGSYWNDTINGGDGDDVIYGFYGKNKVDGGNGADTYHIFSKGESGTEDFAMVEETTVKDTGKDAGIDTARLHCTVDDLQNGKLWFNVKADGTYNSTFNVLDSNGNKATITGVEEIYVDGKKYDINQVASDVAAWLQSNGGFADVQTALNKSITTVDNELYAMFTEDKYFA